MSLLLYEMLKKDSKQDASQEDKTAASQEDKTAAGQEDKTAASQEDKTAAGQSFKGRSNKRKLLTPAQQLRMDIDRQHVVDHYRMMKKAAADSTSL